MAKRKSKYASPVFYGWWLLSAGTILMAMQGAFIAYGFNAFFVPLANTFGTTRGVLSLAFSFTRLEGALLGPIGGYLIDHLGPRTMIFIGLIILGFGFLMFSTINSILGFYMVLPLIALGASWSGFLPIVTSVNNWFHRKRGLATGISSAGVNLGGVLVVFVAVSIGSYGWRTSALVIGIACWIVGMPLASFLRHKPQQYGYLPDGDHLEENTNIAVKSLEIKNGNMPTEPALISSDFTAGQAIRTQAFWIITCTHSISVLIISMVTVHEIPLLVDAGISFETAASLLAFMTGIAVIGRVSGGYLADKIGMKPVLLACFFMMSAGVIVLATATTIMQAVVWAVLYGLGYGARAPILIALRGDYFGPTHFATIMGFSQPIMVLGMFLGPIIAGFAYDAQGSYKAVFILVSLVNLLGAALVPFIKKPILLAASDQREQ